MSSVHDEAGIGRSSPSPSSIARSIRKKRGASSVTPNACISCKKAKAKCDGVIPTCTRCVRRSQHSECHYEIHTKTQKEVMIKEIRDLREKSTLVELIVKAIRTSEGPEVLRRVKNGESYGTISDSLQQPLFPGYPSMSAESRVQLIKAVAEYKMDMEGERYGGKLIEGHSWTNVTQRQDLIDHLIALYFTWVHPVHMLLSENHFMASFKNRSDLYCTKPLVSVILAMACQLFSIGDDASLWPGVDPESLERRFLEEARTLLPQDDCPKMTTVQTLAIMFLVELGSGKGAKASHYLRLAVDSLSTRLEHHYSTEAMEITRWGIYSLNVAWASFIYQIPNTLTKRNPLTEEVFKHVDMQAHAGLWRFYRHTRDTNTAPEYLSSGIQVASANAKLMLQVQNSIYILYHSRDQKITARKLLEQYRAYLDWEVELPEEISLPYGIADTDELSQIVPHVISLHITYHTAQIHLFQPFLHMAQLAGPTRQHIMSITINHARKAYDAMVLYRELYSCRFQPSLQTFCLLHVCEALVRFSPSQPPSSEVVRFCLASLKEAADGKGGFLVCGPLQEMFRRTVESCGISMPEDIRDIMGPKTGYSSEDFLNACTRLSYKQPVEHVSTHTDPGIADDFARDWKAIIDTSGTSGSSNGSNERARNMRIDDLLND